MVVVKVHSKRKQEEEIIEEPEEEKNESGLKGLWNKTVFPDKIKAMKEEKQFKRELQEEAKKRAREKYREQMVEEMAQEEVEKLKGKKKGKITEGLKKLGKEFATMGEGMKDMASDDKINRLLGNNSNTGPNIGNILGNEEPKEKEVVYVEREPRRKRKKVVRKVVEEKKPESFEDKMKRMLE